jgi:hypothetical protein
MHTRQLGTGDLLETAGEAAPEVAAAEAGRGPGGEEAPLRRLRALKQ